MNSLKGEIASVTVNGSLSLVKVQVGEIRLSAIVIDTPETAPHLQPGNAIHVIFKETEVIVGKGTDHAISLQNKMEGKVLSIESGDLLSKLTLDTVAGEITAIITTNAVTQLQLQRGTTITAMVKTNEMMLSI